MLLFLFSIISSVDSTQQRLNDIKTARIEVATSQSTIQQSFNDLNDPLQIIEAFTIVWYTHRLLDIDKYPIHIATVDFAVELSSTENVKDADDWNGKDFPFIIPVFIGTGGNVVGHWVSYVVVKTDEDKLTIYIFDYFTPSIKRKQFGENLTNYVTKKTGIHNIIIKQFSKKFQFDRVNCGIFLMFTMEAFAQGDTITAINTISDIGIDTKSNTLNGKYELVRFILELRISFLELLHNDLRQSLPKEISDKFAIDYDAFAKIQSRQRSAARSKIANNVDAKRIDSFKATLFGPVYNIINPNSRKRKAKELYVDVE